MRLLRDEIAIGFDQAGWSHNLHVLAVHTCKARGREMKGLSVTLEVILGSLCLGGLIIGWLYAFSAAVDEVTNRLDTIIRLLEAQRK